MTLLETRGRAAVEPIWIWEKGASLEVLKTTYYLYEIVPSTHKYSRKSLCNSKGGIRVENLRG